MTMPPGPPIDPTSNDPYRVNSPGPTPPAGHPGGGYQSAPPPQTFGPGGHGQGPYGQGPYGQGPYGAGPSGAGRTPFDGPTAIGYGFSAFTNNIVPFVVVAIVSSLIALVLAGVGFALDGGLDLFRTVGDPTASQPSTFSPFSSIMSIVSSIVSSIIALGILRMAFDVLDGRKAELGRMFQGYSVVTGVLTAVVVGVLTFVGLILCVLPGLAAMVFLMFATPAVVDSGRGVGAAISESVQLVKDNLGPVVIYALLLMLCYIAIICTCGLAGIVLTPVISISLAYGYRVLSGRQAAQPV